jgi:DNA-binding transcriptional ArsR family regulator
MSNEDVGLDNEARTLGTYEGQETADAVGEPEGPELLGIPLKKEKKKVAATKTKKKAAEKAAAPKKEAPVRKPTPVSAKDVSQAERGRLARDKEIAEKLKLISDGTRASIVRILSGGELHVNAICDRLGSSQPAVSHHLALLRHAGIATPRRDGKSNFYSLTEDGEVLANVVSGMAS